MKLRTRSLWASRAAAVLAIGIFAVVSGCDSLPKLGSSEPEVKAGAEERCLRAAFNAIKSGSWEQYKAVSITKADLIMKDNGLSEFHDQASYAGSVLKPEEMELQTIAFEQVTKRNAGTINFGSSTFEGPGTVIATGQIETVDGKSFPFKEYSIKIKGAGGSVDTKDQYPRFVLVPWDKEYRVLKLSLGSSGGFDESSEDETEF